jgi:hypothetical protein
MPQAQESNLLDDGIGGIGDTLVLVGVIGLSQCQESLQLLE